MTASESAPDSLADALGFRRQVRRGAIVGIGLGAALFLTFVVIPGADRPAPLYLGLAAVVAVSVGLLVTLLLLAYRAHRLATGA